MKKIVFKFVCIIIASILGLQIVSAQYYYRVGSNGGSADYRVERTGTSVNSSRVYYSTSSSYDRVSSTNDYYDRVENRLTNSNDYSKVGNASTTVYYDRVSNDSVTTYNGRVGSSTTSYMGRVGSNNDIYAGRIGSNGSSYTGRIGSTSLDVAFGRTAGTKKCLVYTEYKCGIDGKTYLNGCLADMAGVRILHTGKCNTPPSSNNYSCSDTFRAYVCGYHYDISGGIVYRTYLNPCTAKKYGAIVRYSGPCIN